MKHNRIIAIVILILLPFLSGCSRLGWNLSATEGVNSFSVSDQERRFAGALEFLRAGNEDAARVLLERVIEDPPRNGVTDEALFRLAVLSLREDGNRGEGGHRSCWNV